VEETVSSAGGEFLLRDVVQEKHGARLLDGVSLALPGREVTALIGPSGAGKTTLLRLLDRLDDPVSGTVLFHGRPVTEYPIRDLRCRIGFVFQTPVMFPGTVADNLRVAAELAGPERVPDAGQDGWIGELLRAVELDPATYAERDAGRLSGGEKQRVSIARALATRPEVLLLDEPTSALDPEVAERLMSTVARLNRERGHTTVMVTHRLAEARDFSTHTVMLEAGRVVEAGPTRQLFENASNPRTRAYLAVA
jgi:ABC-type methionine transport system ATPase subunit